MQSHDNFLAADDRLIFSSILTIHNDFERKEGIHHRWFVTPTLFSSD